MVRKDAQAASEYWMESKVFAEKRSADGPFDYGDNKTVGLHLKRNSFKFGESDPDNSFGVFLGHHNDGYVVGVKKIDLSGFSACEVFDSVGDLHAEWRLD